MKIIISPAKSMSISENYISHISKAIFLEETKSLLKYFKELSFEDAKNIWKANDKISELNYYRFKNMDLEKASSSAIFSYEGLQYQHLSAHTLDKDALDYLEDKLYIMSGFYGLLKPSTLVMPYRLEMQALIAHEFKNKLYTNLYDFWGDKLIDEIIKNDEDKIIINLASKEYSKCISKYAKQKGVSLIDINFYEEKDGKIKQKATLAKMARGEFLRSIALKKINKINELKDITVIDFKFSKDKSSEFEFSYVKSI